VGSRLHLSRNEPHRCTRIGTHPRDRLSEPDAEGRSRQPPGPGASSPISRQCCAPARRQGRRSAAGCGCLPRRFQRARRRHSSAFAFGPPRSASSPGVKAAGHAGDSANRTRLTQASQTGVRRSTARVRKAADEQLADPSSWRLPDGAGDSRLQSAVLPRLPDVVQSRSVSQAERSANTPEISWKRHYRIWGDCPSEHCRICGRRPPPSCLSLKPPRGWRVGSDCDVGLVHGGW